MNQCSFHLQSLSLLISRFFHVKKSIVWLAFMNVPGSVLSSGHNICGIILIIPSFLKNKNKQKNYSEALTAEVNVASPDTVK